MKRGFVCQCDLCLMEVHDDAKLDLFQEWKQKANQIVIHSPETMKGNEVIELGDLRRKVSYCKEMYKLAKETKASVTLSQLDILPDAYEAALNGLILAYWSSAST